MAIVTSELVFYKSQIVNDLATNGGRMSSNKITSGVSNNLWPDLTEGERSAGSDTYRKVFLKIENAGDLALLNSGIFLDTATPADDAVYIFPGTQIDTQSDLTGSERLFGSASLSVGASAGATTIDVVVEDPAIGIFFDADRIRITNKASPTSETGEEEFKVISGTPSVSGNVVTLTLASALLYTYASGVGTRIHAVLDSGDVATDTVNGIVTSAAGAFDQAEVVLDNFGTVYQNWTYTFTSATAYTLVGDTLGSLGTGSTGVQFSPTNPDFGAPYLTVPVTAWSGTFAPGDIVTATTIPAAYGFWERRIVPALTDSFTGNTALAGALGESS